ncbi:hypothetical protein CWI38_0532p0020 [Hamiltosporidium tvaerminnensis]|uniref:Uncharacterized protein n=1 Tax=Hamiltosporidium tvaerminnensis TaxID=1176355 RepID=A0A4Q9LXJ0_9MICR|nr:hypothetical protein CWI38_0532p0020 [Hamiltosporidium tvaerminnensis]
MVYVSKGCYVLGYSMVKSVITIDRLDGSMVKSVITIDRLDGSMVKSVIDNVHRYRGVIDMYLLVKGVSYKGRGVNYKY